MKVGDIGYMEINKAPHGIRGKLPGYIGGNQSVIDAIIF